MPKILTTGYEASIRSMLGVKASELPDTDINQRMVLDLAEAKTIRRIPLWADLTDDTDLLYLETAVLAYMCYLLCPSMARRLNTEVTTIDVKWKKASVNWADKAEEFLAQFEDAASIIAPEDFTRYTSTIMGIAKRTEEAAE
ncbi:hypothetical protein [Paenibacillus xylanexedens]|uniref:hypothetical protein n=1 Tax=Paenibacillus xylanexedens TaxID=528191 RepID=UPI0011A15046|nr:hypothetical protein [Paenibacillus xylanexedens]